MCGRLNDLTKLVRQIIFTPHSSTVNCYSLHQTARLLQRLGNARDVVAHISGNVELQPASQ
jgi:hypothetical protein